MNEIGEGEAAKKLQHVGPTEEVGVWGTATAVQALRLSIVCLP